MNSAPLRLVRDRITRAEIDALAKSGFDDMVKAVVYPGEQGEGFVEFDSMINVRPAQGNSSRDVIDPSTRERIRATVTHLVAE